MLVLIRRWPSVSLCLHVHLVLRSNSLYQNWTHTHTHTHARTFMLLLIRRWPSVSLCLRVHLCVGVLLKVQPL